MNNIDSNTGEIVMYQPDETIRLEVRVENETVWLTQQQMADLFLTTKQNISLHINNIFNEDELTKNSVVKESLTTAKDGKRYKTNFYNLDVIISVGYRVKSKRGTKFRQWANRVLKDQPPSTPVNSRKICDSSNLTSSDIISSTNPSPSISASDARLCRLLPTGRKNHDRFLIVDDVVFLFGASLKDAGKKLFAYIKMQETPASELLNNIR